MTLTYEYIRDYNNNIDNGIFFFTLRITMDTLTTDIYFGFLFDSQCEKFLKFCHEITTDCNNYCANNKEIIFYSHSRDGDFQANMTRSNRKIIFYYQIDHVLVSNTISLDDFIPIAQKICDDTK
jgi:hypothetical protein